MFSNTMGTNSEKCVKNIGITGSSLKLIAIVSMLLDHIAAVVLYYLAVNTNNSMLFSLSHIMRKFGRLAFPIFCFLLIEGMLHTRNRKKYALRLGIFALISEIPYDLAFTGQAFNTTGQNVFFTLLIGLVVITCFQKIETSPINKKSNKALAIGGVLASILLTIVYIIPMIFDTLEKLSAALGVHPIVELNLGILVLFAVVAGIGWMSLYKVMGNKKSTQEIDKAFSQVAILFIGIVTAIILNTDYSDIGILTIAIMYKLRKNQQLSMLGGSLIVSVLTHQMVPLFDTLIIYFYNGKRGLNLKYLFYIFYPLHLLILYFIGHALQVV